MTTQPVRVIVGIRAAVVVEEPVSILVVRGTPVESVRDPVAVRVLFRRVHDGRRLRGRRAPAASGDERHEQEAPPDGCR